MSGRLGIDFGTSNSVIGLTDDATGRTIVLDLPGLSVLKPSGESQVRVLPSLVHYDEHNIDRVLFAAQVLESNLYDHDHTFRWMKRYIGDRTSAPRKVGSRMISPLDAGQAFVTVLAATALAEIGGDLNEEIAFSAPVEAFEHYESWLRDVAEAAGVRRFRLIDEASAAALGYGTHIQAGDVYLVFDFGGGTLDVAVVKIEQDTRMTPGRRCRVLGKAGTKIGGSTIDGWIFNEVLARQGLKDTDESVRPLATELLVACEAAKETLSSDHSTEITAIDAATGARLSQTFTRADLEDLLDRHEVFTRIDTAIDRAIAKAQDRGYGKDFIKKALLVGGSSLIPSVQTHVTRRLGRDRVLLDRPLEAVALGASAFVSGIDFYDHIQHSYAIRHVDPESHDYNYRTIVTAGTSYPTDGVIADFTVKAVFDGQDELGIAIYELAEDPGSVGTVTELIFDPAGVPRTVEVSLDDRKRRSHFWMNERNPTFLRADPPAEAGEARFKASFHIDENKRLLITATDLRSRQWVFDRYPVVKLT